MEGLVHETEKMLGILKGNELRDAGLIASAQKLEHYEMAAYGTAAALAGQLDFRDDQRTLHVSLEEERQADLLLTPPYTVSHSDSIRAERGIVQSAHCCRTRNRKCSAGLIIDQAPPKQERQTVQTIDVQDYARQLLDAQGFRAIAQAAQKASAFEAQGDAEQAQTWRRIEAALIEMRGPHES
jgi:hypothetical protein